MYLYCKHILETILISIFLLQNRVANQFLDTVFYYFFLIISKKVIVKTVAKQKRQVQSQQYIKLEENVKSVQT